MVKVTCVAKYKNFYIIPIIPNVSRMKINQKLARKHIRIKKIFSVLIALLIETTAGLNLVQL